MLSKVSAFLNWLDGFVWGVPLIVLILATGIFLTIRLRGIQFHKLGMACKYMFQNENEGHGEVSSFAALCTALSATIGTGNIVGVATALVSGGAGALFWMWIAALFGMATKYAEGVLAIKYRTIDESGHVLGGPFYYIENGMGKNWRWLGKIFAFFGAGVGLLGIGTFTQVNGITAAAGNFFDQNMEHVINLFGNDYSIAVVITGIILTICVALVVLGGIQRIASVSSIIVPFMAVFYIIACIAILVLNAARIPAAFAEIIQSAFGLRAAAGGALGAVLIAMQKGIARGIFSNEAGLGSAPIAAAAAQTKEPARQGLVTMTGTFIDTIIVCTMTGLCIVLTGSHTAGLEGVAVTTRAFQMGLPVPAQFFRISSDDVPDLLRLHHHHRMELLRRALPGVFIKRKPWRSYGIPLSLHPGHLHRTVHDRRSRLDHCRYLQCPDGTAEPDRTAGVKRCGCGGNKRLLDESAGR